jgi:hypothetical protein
LYGDETTSNQRVLVSFEMWFRKKYGSILQEMKPRRRGMNCIQYKEGRQTGLVIFCVGTAL